MKTNSAPSSAEDAAKKSIPVLSIPAPTDNCPTQWRMAGDELVSADVLPTAPAMDEAPLFQPWQPPLGAFPPRPLPPEMYLPVMQEQGRPGDEE